MKKIFYLLVLSLFIISVISCTDKQKKTAEFKTENNICLEPDETETLTFDEIQKLLKSNAIAHNYHWWPDSRGSEDGMLVLDRTADMEWIKQNLSPAFKYVTSIQLKNNDFSLIPLMENCTSVQVYNDESSIAQKLDILIFPKTYNSLTFYNCDVQNLSSIKDFTELIMLNTDCETEELLKMTSLSLEYLTIRTTDNFDFSVLNNFPNLKQIKIERSLGFSNIEKIEKNNIQVIYIRDENEYLEYKTEFDELSEKYPDIKIWHGAE